MGDAIDCANFGAELDLGSAVVPKFAQSNHSPTANLRLPPYFLWIQLWVGDAIDCANFGAELDLGSAVVPKFAQSNHSPTANLRILFSQ